MDHLYAYTFVFLLQKFVIEKEDRYLEKKFGQISWI